MRRVRLDHRAHRPVRGNPFPRGVSQKRGQIDKACGLIDRRGLDRGDLVLAERLAHNIETARQRSIAEGLLCPIGITRSDGGRERFLRVDELDLRLGQSCR
jgi:hypothetical protein